MYIHAYIHTRVLAVAGGGAEQPPGVSACGGSGPGPPGALLPRGPGLRWAPSLLLLLTPPSPCIL